jgi:hypothetical protein
LSSSHSPPYLRSYGDVCVLLLAAAAAHPVPHDVSKGLGFGGGLFGLVFGRTGDRDFSLLVVVPFAAAATVAAAAAAVADGAVSGIRLTRPLEI